jgi:hypothetical protein
MRWFWTKDKVQTSSSSDHATGNGNVCKYTAKLTHAPPLRGDWVGVGVGGTVTDRAVYEQLERQLHSGRAHGLYDGCSTAPPPAALRNEIAAQEIQVSAVT